MDTGTPSTSRCWRSGSTRSPRTATTPSIVTRPSVIRPSQARRDPSPARESTFWTRSTRSGTASASVVARVVGHGGPETRVVESGILVEPQPALERLDHFGAGHEVAQRRKRGEAPEPETLEEPGRRAVQDGEAGPGVAAHFLDVAALHECREGRLDTHPADRRDLAARDGLLVRDDREGL